jgi:hypothetical protein
VAYNFQTGNNKIKLLTEYESVTQKVLILLESILQTAKQLQHAHLSWHIRCPRVLQHLRCVSIAATSLSFSSSREVTRVL